MPALIFDLDNTLFDHAAAMRRHLCRVGIPDEHLDDLLRFDALGSADRLEFCARVASVAPTPTTADAVWRELRRGLAAQARLEDGISQMLREARGRWSLALLTNGGSDTQRAKITALGLDDVFDADRILISAEIGVAKPDRRAFELALERVGADAARTVYVGDDPVCDVQGAQAVGITTCWVARGRSFPDTPGPDWTIEAPLELADIWHEFPT